MYLKRLLPIAAALGAAIAAVEPGSRPAPNFDAKLNPEERIQHALSRLTFGARPGDADEVRRMGVDKWIELQLHPERIAENPTLESRLKPLETLRMDDAAIYKEYYLSGRGMMMVTPRRINLNEMLPGEQFRKVFNGTAEERHASLLALPPEKRMEVLTVVPQNVVDDLPDMKKEREEAVRKQNEERQAELRRMRPPLTDLLEPAQVHIAMSGSAAERDALLASLDAGKREQVIAVMPPNALSGRPELRRMAAMSRNPRDVPSSDLREAKLYRAIYSNRQLEEVLTDFWFNHFNVYENKGQQGRSVLVSYERDAIRPHVLGKFKNLLLAVAHHPAMLYYLDNWESMAPDALEVGPFAPVPTVTGNGVIGGGRGGPFSRLSHGLNENYGREILELHTLGVNGGYTQQDVIAVARCFTGWSIRQPVGKPEFVFAGFMHDDGEKVVLGHKIAAGGGESDGLQVIDILAHHPSTARFISTKLARRFVADMPPPALIDRMARTFLKTDGDLRAVLETMFTSHEFFSEGARNAKIKSPLEFVAGAVRALNADVEDTFTLAQNVADMGEPLYNKEVPAGYKDTADAWLSTANVVARIKFAENLATGKVPGVKVDLSRFDNKPAVQIAREILGHEPSPAIVNLLDAGVNHAASVPGTVYCAVCSSPATVVGSMLSSPEFQRR